MRYVIVKKAGLDAVGLAARGQKRLGLASKITSTIPTSGYVPGSMGRTLKAGGTAMKANAKGFGDATRASAMKLQTSIAGKHAEQIADELDMLDGVEPRFLREAPIPKFAEIELPYLHPKLAYDQDGLRIRVDADLGEAMLKIAAKPPGGSSSFKMPGFPEGFIVLPAPTALTNAAHAAARATGELAHSPSFGERMTSIGQNLWNVPKTIVTGEGTITPAQKLQAGLVVGLAAGAGLGIRALYKRRQVQQQYDAVLAKVMDDPNHQNLTDKEQKVPEAYAFLRRYAPTLALDPTIARAFVRMAMTNEDQLHTAQAQVLSVAEKEHREATKPKGELKEWLSHPIAAPFAGGGGGGGKR